MTILCSTAICFPPCQEGQRCMRPNVCEWILDGLELDALKVRLMGFALHKLWIFSLPSWAVSVAQLVEHLSSTQKFAGLNPTSLEILELCSSMVAFALPCLIDWVACNCYEHGCPGLLLINEIELSCSSGERCLFSCVNFKAYPAELPQWLNWWMST